MLHSKFDHLFMPALAVLIGLYIALYTHPSHELDFGPADHEIASELNLR